jgi:hypothetical protein
VFGNNNLIKFNKKSNIKTNTSSSSPLSISKNISKAKADSGSTGHYISLKDISMLQNIKADNNPIIVYLADGSTISSIYTANILIPGLNPAETKAYVFEELEGSLISIGMLCDIGCIVTYSKQKVIVEKNDEIIMEGLRDKSTGLWNFIFNNTVQNSNLAYAASYYPSSIITSPFNLVNWYHACMGSPSVSTFYNAIVNGWIDLPDISASIARNLKPTMATYKGHLDQKRSGLDSTKFVNIENDSGDHIKNSNDVDDAMLNNKHNIHVSMIDTATIHQDLSGKFPTKSRLSNNYISIMYNLDTNYILAIPQKTRSATDYINTYQKGLDFWESKGITPTFLRIDNEISSELVQFLSDRPVPINIELVSPGIHRASIAERAMRTWKNHFISMLATTDNNFPSYLWEDLIPLAELTLNLMRQSTIGNDRSAWQMLHNKNYDFRAHPIAPPGIKVISHNKPDNRGTWAEHGIEGYYIGPALLNYRCHIIYVPSTKSNRVSDTIGWLPKDGLLTSSKRNMDLQLPLDSNEIDNASVNDIQFDDNIVNTIDDDIPPPLIFNPNHHSKGANLDINTKGDIIEKELQSKNIHQLETTNVIQESVKSMGNKGKKTKSKQYNQPYQRRSKRLQEKNKKSNNISVQ